MKEKENAAIKHLEENINKDKKSNFVPICLVLIIALLFGIIFKMHATNKYLKIISDYYNPGSYTIVTPGEKYDSVSEVFDKNEVEYNSLVNKENNSDTNSDDTAKEETTSIDDGTPKTAYVLNTSSKKIHYPSCSVLSRTKDENKKSVNLSNEELNNYKNKGYTLCNTCGGK